MDYKVFIQEFDNSKKSFIEYISSCNKKNIAKVDKLVNEYLKNISEENYSIKSYKAKIIHNELEHSRTRREIYPLKEQALQNINDLIDLYFKEYLDELNNLNIFISKNKDLREFIQNNRRQKHDVLLKRNNVEKEFNLKNKEFENGKNEIVNSYNEKISELKSKLANNLKKSNDKTVKEFQEYESTLLNCDDRDEIKKIKENIKNVRLIGLDEEFNFKVETYQTILEEELKYNQNYFDFITNFEDYKKETQIKLAEYEKINTELNLNNEFKDKSYEYELKKQKLDLLLLECEKFVEIVKKHNQLINIDYSFDEYTKEEKLFLFDIIEVNFYRLLLAIRKNNLYDPLVTIFISFIDGLNNLKVSFKDVYETIITRKEEQQDNLLKALDSYVPATKKKTSKDDLINNTITSLNRFYRNFENELDSFVRIIFDFYMTLIDKIISTVNDIKELKEVNEFGKDIFIGQTNYKFVDLKEYGYTKLINNYKFSNFNSTVEKKEIEEIEIELDISNLIIDGFKVDNLKMVDNDEEVNETDTYFQTLENNLFKLEEDIQLYCNLEFNKIELKINELETIRNKKINEADLIYKESIKFIDKKYKNMYESMSSDKIEKDKEIKKSTSKYVNNAKKLLVESKSML